MNGLYVFNRIISESRNAERIIKEETDMVKKVLAGLLAAALILPVGTAGALAATRGQGRYFVDEDGDGVCDNYGRCGGGGYRRGGCGQGRYFEDQDGDGICDHYAEGNCPQNGTGWRRSSTNTPVKASQTKVSIRKGKTYRLKTKQIKKLSGSSNVSYESSNPKVAAVTKKGVIRAKKKGKCTVYAYAGNEICRKVKVTVSK